MYLKEIGYEGVDWTDLAQDRQGAGCCEHSDEHPCFVKRGNFLTSRKSMSFLKRNLLYSA